MPYADKEKQRQYYAEYYQKNNEIVSFKNDINKRVKKIDDKIDVIPKY